MFCFFVVFLSFNPFIIIIIACFCGVFFCSLGFLLILLFFLFVVTLFASNYNLL